MKTIPIKHLDATKADFVPYRIRSLEELLNGKDFMQPHHRHDFYFVLLLANATGEHIIDFKSYKISNNAIFILRPGQVHQLTLKRGSQGYVLQVSREFFMFTDQRNKEAFLKAVNRNYCKPELKRFIKIKNIAESIYAESTERGVFHLEAIKAYLGLFFIEYARQSANPKSSSRSSKTEYTQARYEELLSLVEENIATMKEVSAYADKLNLSAYQINAITKTIAGKTCSQIIQEQIILEAKRQLLATTNQVNQVAYELGYEDVSYFIRLFKKHTGSSPDAFRNKFK